jgi:hypothetical protein
LFSTPHGSRLYGLATPTSDHDTYTVLETQRNSRRRYAKQTIVGDLDDMVVDLPTWLAQCAAGVPQALEAMFSRVPTHDELTALRAGYRVTTQAWDKYLRTISNFIYVANEKASKNYKSKRHALRLAVNMNEFRAKGYFNPTLTPELRDFVTEYAHKDTDVASVEVLNGCAYRTGVVPLLSEGRTREFESH